MPESSKDSSVPHSQTLDRGIRLLEYLAEAEKDLTITQLTEGLGLTAQSSTAFCAPSRPTDW